MSHQAPWGRDTILNGHSFRNQWLRDFERYTNLREIEFVVNEDDIETLAGIWHKYKWPCERDGLKVTDAVGRTWHTEELDRVVGIWRARTVGRPESNWIRIGGKLRELADELMTLSD